MPYSLLSKFMKVGPVTGPVVPESNLSDEKTTALESADWVLQTENEGQLAIDLYKTKDALVMKSTIAGVTEDDLAIHIANDLLTIKGQRQRDEVVAQEDYFYQECYWGGFSRTVVLPMEIISEGVEASLKHGVLTIHMPLAQKSRSIKVKVKQE